MEFLKRNRVTVVILILTCVFFFAWGESFLKEYDDLRLLQETPMGEMSYWYSLDNFPKYKLEAARFVAEQMENGVSKEDACMAAVDMTSDKIYQDTLDFYEKYPDTPAEEWTESLYAYYAEIQNS